MKDRIGYWDQKGWQWLKSYAQGKKRKVLEAAAMALRTSTTLGQNSFSCALFWSRTGHRLHVSDWTMLPSELQYLQSMQHIGSPKIIAMLLHVKNLRIVNVVLFWCSISQSDAFFQWTHRSLGGKGLLFVSWCIDKRVAVRLTAPEAVA